MILDGNPVIIEYEDDYANDEGKKVILNSRASSFSTKSFKGTAGDYTKFVKKYKKANINAGGLIIDCGAGVIATIVAAALKASLGYAVALSAVATLATKLENAAETYGPKSAYFSYNVTKYEYKKNTAPDHYYFYTGNYYVQKNYKGHSTPHRFYELNYFC